MSQKKGIIALMGSGELTSTMVEVHKELLSGLPDSPKAFFLDTPAGFELNSDQISKRALAYFDKHVRQPMTLASYKSKDTITSYEATRTFQRLKEADFVLIGPGSPSYAVRQWEQTPIPDILTKRIEEGGCMVAASAAALTVGRFTLPVYEIYKVGQEVHWVEGTNILGRFGFNLVVLPHWNNAEGGTHDTRFCYMGELRLKQLESLLPPDVTIFGLDEHTACLMDFEKEEAVVKGIGSVTMRRGGVERVFQKSERFPLSILRTGDFEKEGDVSMPIPSERESTIELKKDSFWDKVHKQEEAFSNGIKEYKFGESTGALLDLDRTIWKAQQDQENPEFISQARDTLREFIVSLGTRLESAPKSRAEILSPIVEELLKLRQKFRAEKQFEAADEIRDVLKRAEIIVEDTKDGARWKLQ